MPEGPSIVILKEAVAPFKGKIIRNVSGNSKVDIARMEGKKILDFKSWGKHFLICLPGFTVRIHFLLFGTYRINEAKESPARLHLGFTKGQLNFYACSIQLLDENPDDIYDWSADVMNPVWNSRRAIKKLRAQPDTLACDAILDQDIFAGAGNIFKNEVLFRIKVHPLSPVGSLPTNKLRELVKETQAYSFQFLEWKKAYVLKKHWLAHTKRTCPRCKIPFEKKHLGKTHRRSFYCESCQKKYD